MLANLGASAVAITAVLGLAAGGIKVTGGDLPPYAPKETVKMLADNLSKTQSDLTNADAALEGLERDRWRQIEREAEADLLVNPKSESAQRDKETATCHVAAIDHPDWHLHCG